MSVDLEEQPASHVICFLWRDSGSLVTLWELATVLPADAAWLGTALRLSGHHIRELTAWADARTALERSGFAHAEATSELDERADDLVARLGAELPSLYMVEYRR
jgi:hypothetical protein